MRILKYNKTMKIENLNSLRPGLGAKYLQCSTHFHGEIISGEAVESFIAFSWRRKLPAGIPSWHVLIEFKYES